MGFCQYCGSQIPDGALYCASCGSKVDASAEHVLGVVLFGGYYRDICFTDRRIIQFEVMRDRWKFLLNVAKPLPLVVESGGKLEDVLPFLKREIQREKVSSLDLAYHGRLTTGHVRVVMCSGEVDELAKIDGDVDRKAFGELVNLVNSLYPEIKKSVA